jgi:hypothetical protein
MLSILRRPRQSSRRRNERDLKIGYFSHVFADLYRLPNPDRDAVQADLPASLRKLLERVEESGDVSPADEALLDWGEIATLEDKILERQGEPTIRRRTWQLRARYARLVGADRYQAYLASGPPDEKDSAVPVELLLADLRRLLGLTHISYSLAMVRETNRRRVMWKVLAWTVGLCAAALIVAVFLLDFKNGALAGTICATVLFGCLGAYISVQRRLQDTSDGGDPVIGILGLHEFNSIQPFPLIAGGMFAVVLYFIIAARFMEGSLFPVLENGVPTDFVNWAKLFIWSLLAGFAERLVPDTLDRLTNQAQLKGDSTPIIVSPTSSPPQGELRNADATKKEAKKGGTLEPQLPADLKARLDEIGATERPTWATPADDPNRGQFGGQAEKAGWRLTATATSEEKAPQVVRVQLMVDKAMPDAKDFAQVVWRLSSAFKETTASTPITAGRAQLGFPTFYPFVAAAELKNGGETIALECDLGSVWPKT